MHPITLSATVLAVLFAVSPTAGAQSSFDPGQPGSGRAVFIAKDRAAARVVSVVYQGQFSFVRIETREPGAPLNEHPFAIEPAGLRTMLAAVTLDDAKKTPLFGDDELKELVPPLAQALGTATAEQDVSFAIAGRYGYFGPLAARSVTTARVFRRDGKLQVIFGLLRNPFESQFRATGYLLPFDPGQRAEPVDRSTHVLVASNAGDDLRADWVALNLRSAPPAPAPSASTAIAPMSATQAAAPTAPTASAPAATSTAAAVAAPAPAADANAIAAHAAERLKALQKLRDQGLISEQEYLEKRAQILREL